MDQRQESRGSVDLFKEAGRDTRGGTIGEGRETLDVDAY